jgi:cell shape-determining protein MreC
MVYLSLMAFCAWYTVVGLLVSIAHPKPSNFRLFIISVLVATVLILSSQGWNDSSIDVLNRTNSWLMGYAQYIVVVPVFFVIGVFTEKYAYTHAQNRYTLKMYNETRGLVYIIVMAERSFK